MFDFSFNFNPNAIHNITTLKEAMIDNFLAEKEKGTKVYAQELLDYILYIVGRTTSKYPILLRVDSFLTTS